MSANAIKPILICYDGSEGARRAIETTGVLFPGRRAIVLHAWSPMAIIAASYLGALTMLDYDDEAAQAAASKIAEEGCNLAKEAGLKAQPEITEVTLDGTPHVILDIARPVRSRVDRARSARALYLQVHHARLRVAQRRATRSPSRADRATARAHRHRAEPSRARGSHGMRRRTFGDARSHRPAACAGGGGLPRNHVSLAQGH